MIVVVIGESLLVLFVILFPASGYGEFNYHWRYYAPVPDEYHGNIRVTGTIFSIKLNLERF